MHRTSIISPTVLLAALLISLPLEGPAHAQQAQLNNLPPNTVVGRLGSSVPGPAQAIPLSTLLASGGGSQTANTVNAAPNGVSGLPTFRSLVTADLPSLITAQTANTILGNNTGSPATTSALTATQTNNLLSTAPWNDASAVIGSKGSFWTSSGSAIVHRFNRLLVGEAALGGSQQTPSPKDWLETLAGGSVSFGQISVVNNIGLEGVVAGTRTSDYRTAFSAAAGNALGVTGVGVNDDTSGTPIAEGVYAVAIRKSGVGGQTQAAQVDPNNGGSVVDSTPFDGYHSGSIQGLNVTAGSLGGLGTANISAGIILGAGATNAFRRGIVVTNGSLDTSIGAAAAGIVTDVPNGASMRWSDTGGAVDAETFGNTKSISNGGNAVVMSGAGSILVQDTNVSENAVALYLCSGGVCLLVNTTGATAGTWVASTTSPASTHLSVAYTGSAYAVYNNAGGTRVVQFYATQTQATP